MVPGLWLNEGGQSAAGAAIDHLLGLHPAHSTAKAAAEGKGFSLPDWLGREAADAIGDGSLSDVVNLVAGLHVAPEFMGNRAPHADPRARAVIAGLGIDDGPTSLVALYVAGLCGLGYGLRQIIEVQANRGAAIERIVVSGGAGQADIVRRLIADTTGKPVFAVASDEPVLLGSAILGAVAAGCFEDIPTAMRAMTALGGSVEPADGRIAELHEHRFAAFERLQAMAREIRDF